MPPHENLLSAVRTGFILKQTTFKAWCRENGIDPGYAHHVIAGKTNGPKAQQLRKRIVGASSGNMPA
jgi:hypothetical protein